MSYPRILTTLANGMKMRQRSGHAASRGRLRIGGDWNAINIIALSQSNSLKAVAEFVENSIDADATKAVVLKNFPGLNPGDLLEWMIDCRPTPRRT